MCIASYGFVIQVHNVGSADFRGIKGLLAFGIAQLQYVIGFEFLCLVPDP